MRPPPFGQPQYMPRPPNPTVATTTPAPDTNTNEKLTTLFIGAIAPGVSDDWIVKLLEVRNKELLKKKLYY